MFGVVWWSNDELAAGRTITLTNDRCTFGANNIRFSGKYVSSGKSCYMNAVADVNARTGSWKISTKAKLQTGSITDADHYKDCLFWFNAADAAFRAGAAVGRSIEALKW